MRVSSNFLGREVNPFLVVTMGNRQCSVDLNLVSVERAWDGACASLKFCEGLDACVHSCKDNEPIGYCGECLRRYRLTFY